LTANYQVWSGNERTTARNARTHVSYVCYVNYTQKGGEKSAVRTVCVRTLLVITNAAHVYARETRNVFVAKYRITRVYANSSVENHHHHHHHRRRRHCDNTLNIRHTSHNIIVADNVRAASSRRIERISRRAHNNTRVSEANPLIGHNNNDKEYSLVVPRRADAFEVVRTYPTTERAHCIIHCALYT